MIALGLVPALLVRALISTPAILASLRRVAIRRHLWRQPPVEPDGPPLEKLAADLRRLRPAVHCPPPGITMAKHLGVVGAYDDRLAATAKALDVATSLTELPAGFDREAERIRVEHALTCAGLDWREAS